MSELGNTIRRLRSQAKQSQRQFAVDSGISQRTVLRVENGGGINLATLREISRHFKLSGPDHSELLVAWLRMELGPDFQAVHIEPRGKGRKTGTDAEKFADLFRSVPQKYQKELLLAIQREEVLRSIVPINEIYDKLQKGYG